ncbi:SDR family NAD(P)-dependent oxidoreductase [Arthrobacter castelli]|uniref:SDR family NAD(P)-dependent oxidoreductase n=1 Tax=Arthrobacter castelli TaxID=271431 RepID=UPI000424DC3D|nr:SDR family oxidoreductase [Arthrobacter castelli]
MINPQLQGKVVLVTGGSGGIGAAICQAFDAVGARLAVHFVQAASEPPQGASWEHITPKPAAALEFVRSLRDGVAVQQDLSEPDACTTLVDKVEQELGPVDVLVNNAAHCESPDTFEDLTEDGLVRHYLLNSAVPIRLIAEVSRRRSDTELAVTNISTDAARAFPGQIGYGTSKAALEAATRAAALDLGPTGVRVNAVAPGPIQTGWMSEEMVARAPEMIPLGRVGYPDDIADTCVFLSSYQARFITGQVIQVAGGHAI